MTDVFSTEHRTVLLSITKASIKHGLDYGRPMEIHTSDYADALQQHRASFVTLNIAEKLRGCIGTLEAFRPLIEDVARNAHAAAFSDPRFPPLSGAEFSELEIHLSILSKPEILEFEDEQDLLNKIRPGIDGLILKQGARRGTFLPSVWESLPEPRDFLDHLKQKAGLSTNYWSNTLHIERYTTESFSGN